MEIKPKQKTALPAQTGYPAVDSFRIVAALLVVAVHTSPLASVNAVADFVLARVVARLAVPFFFMASGFFLAKGRGGLKPFLLKQAKLYAVCVLLYLPLNLYTGTFARPHAAPRFLLDILWNGTAYHLWYFPAVLLGSCIAWVLWRHLPAAAALGIAGALYLVGTGGDSWYSLLAGVPALRGFYGVVLGIFPYTRNGLFFAPLFLLLGMLLAAKPPALPKKGAVAGFALALTTMVAEGLFLRGQGPLRHDSMYITLPFCSFLLFWLLMQKRGGGKPVLRGISSYIFILHPWCIVGVRMAAKLLRLQPLLVDVSPVFYLCVCVASLALALLLVQLPKPPLPRGRGKKAAPPRAWAEVDGDALLHNYAHLCTLLPPGARIMAVVKANAYGHGAVWVARTLQRAGARAFAVASLQEGAALRRAGIRGTILVLGYTPPQFAKILRLYRLTQTVVDAAHAAALSAQRVRLRVHIKVDTGMHRLGVPAKKVEDIAAIYALPHLRVEGLYTHLARAEGTAPEDEAFTRAQTTAYYALVNALQSRGVNVGKTHLQSSYGLLHHPGLACGYARCGLALYGVAENLQTPYRQNGGALRPVLSLRARVASVRLVKKGEWVGYGREHRCEKDAMVATLAIGYGDGVPRGLANAYVLVNGAPAPVVGRVCMDQMSVDVTALPGVQPGDVATLVGCAGGLRVGAEALASAGGSIANEWMAALPPRVQRIYRRPGARATLAMQSPNSALALQKRRV